jgi:hypothetical protein
MMRFPRLNPERLSKPSDHLSRAASACSALQRGLGEDLAVDRRMGAGCAGLLARGAERRIEALAKRHGFGSAEELEAELERRLGGRASYYLSLALVRC